MTQKEKIIKLAFIDGWRLSWQNKGGGDLFNEKPSGHCWPVWTPPQKWWDSPVGRAATLSGNLEVVPPKYFEDLNAVHELEKVLTFDQETEYIANLMRQHKDYPMTKGFMSTATQRCEALGKTLNLW